VIREFSAGGLAIRRFRGRDFLVAVRVKEGKVLALPKGHIDPGESSAEAATRELREEAGIDGRLVEKLGDVKYWYSREGERVMKVVSFFLFRYRSGSVRNHDFEVDSAEWIPLVDAPRLLSYRGEREMAEKALAAVGGDPAIAPAGR
jgi:8-oxo-dGTP pyrophosphatase MutT (NUDIX family)